MKRIFSILFALVLVLSLSLVTAVPASAATLNVPSGPYPTIQSAVTAANPNDTINVAAGVYDEQVEIGKSLTLQGAGDTTIIQPSGASTLTTVKTTPWIGGGTKQMAAIVFVDTAGTVTIKDLKVDGSLIVTRPSGIADDNWVTGIAYLETSGTIDTVTVQDVLIQNEPKIRTCGIWASAISSVSTVEVTECTVEGYNRAGIYALGGTMTADYHHNEINGPGALTAQVPNGMYFLEGATGSATYNIITDLGYTGETWRSAGIGTYPGTGDDIVFSHNEISNVQNAFALRVSGTTVEYNTIYDCHTGVRVGDDATNSIIRYNDMHDNDFAIRCDPDMGDGNVAHCNNFVNHPGLEEFIDGATYEGAVCNASLTYTFDAENNWWGDVSGPYHPTTNTGGLGDEVSDNVDYEPWSYTPDPCEPKSKGFWKNHPDSLEAVLDGETVLLGDPYEVADFDDAEPVFDNERAKCAEDMLAPQLLAAKLNVLHLTHLGIDTDCIDATIVDADAELDGYNPATRCSIGIRGKDKQDMLALSDVLDSFNNGEMCGCACEWD